MKDQTKIVLLTDLELDWVIGNLRSRQNYIRVLEPKAKIEPLDRAIEKLVFARTGKKVRPSK